MTSDALPILYSFRRCPYAMRARMAVAISNQQCELREVKLRDKPTAMLEASQKGTVPVLQLPDGMVIDESIDVMRWALGANDPQDWLRADTEAATALIDENDGPFKHHLDRYKYATRYEDANPEAHRSAGEEFLKKLNARLQRADYLFGDAPSLADIAIFPFIRQFRIADPDWFDEAPYPHLQDWLARCLGSSLFQSVMTKYAPWAPGDELTLFPATDGGSTV